MVDTVIKVKVGQLEKEARDIFYMYLRKELTGVVQGVSGKKTFLVRFQYGFKNYLYLNQLTDLIV